MRIRQLVLGKRSRNAPTSSDPRAYTSSRAVSLELLPFAQPIAIRAPLIAPQTWPVLAMPPPKAEATRGIHSPSYPISPATASSTASLQFHPERKSLLASSAALSARGSAISCLLSLEPPRLTVLEVLQYG